MTDGWAGFRPDKINELIRRRLETEEERSGVMSKVVHESANRYAVEARDSKNDEWSQLKFYPDAESACWDADDGQAYAFYRVVDLEDEGEK